MRMVQYFIDDYDINTIKINHSSYHVSGYLFLIDNKVQGKLSYSNKDNRVYLTFNPSKLNPYQLNLIKYLLHNIEDKRFYNIDIAIDCYIDIVNADINNHKVHKKSITYNKKNIETIAFGTKSSGKRVIFYDKKAESPKEYKEIPLIHRVEIRLYSSKANNLINTDFCSLLNGYQIKKLKINDSVELKGKSLTTTQKLQIKEYINRKYGIPFTAKEEYKIKYLIKKLNKTDYKPLFDDILKQSEKEIKEQLQGFISDLVEYKEVA